MSNEKFTCSFRDDVFTLQWIHSVEREMWREYYRAKDGELLLFRSQFKTFGAGTPYHEPLITESGFIELMPNLAVQQIYWIISRNVESTIITAQGVILIHQYLDDYSEIKIFSQKKNIWTLLKDSCYDQFSATH